MNPAADQPEFSGSQKIYAALLRAYPRQHRAEYGVAMAQLFRDQCRDAWAEAGGWGMTKLWLRVLPDLVNTSITERLAAMKERKTMNDNLANLNQVRPTSATTTFISVFVTVFLITAIISTAVTFILPESYASTCKLKVENDQPTTNNYSYDPYFIQTTFEIINSRLVLNDVVAKLNLNVEWGKKYFNGETLKTTECVEILKGRMALAPVINTKLIAITVYSDDKNEAATIANAVAESYTKYRYDLRYRYAWSGLKVMEKQYQTETNQISLVQSNMEHLRTVLDIRGDDPTPSISAEELKKFNADMLEQYQRQQAQLSQLEKLQSITATNPMMVRDVLPVITADSALSDLLSQYNEAQRKLAQLTVDFGTNNANVLRVQQLKDKLDQQINQRVAGVMVALETQLTSLKVSLDKLVQKVEASKSNDVVLAAKYKPYYDEKNLLGQLRNANDLTHAKLLQIQMDNRIPKPQLAQVTDPAEPGRTPVKPNKTLDILFGVMMGIVLGTIAGGLAVWVSTRRANRRKNAAAV